MIAQKPKPSSPAWKQKKTRDEIQYLQDLRRSNAASPHRNKSKYSRKQKHRNKGWE